jgi:hypothetical protein
MRDKQMAVNLDKAKMQQALGITPIPLTLGTRMGKYAQVFYEGGYIWVRAGATLDVWASAILIGADINFGFGTYQWKGLVNPEANKGMIPFGFERYHGIAGEGLIDMRVDDTTYYARTNWQGNSTYTVLGGQDWSIEKTFKIVWSNTKVEFYVDGALVATHTTNIPQVPMSPFMESWTHADNPPVNDALCRGFKDFQKMA